MLSPLTESEIKQIKQIRLSINQILESDKSSKEKHREIWDLVDQEFLNLENKEIPDEIMDLWGIFNDHDKEYLSDIKQLQLIQKIMKNWTA